MLEKIKQKLKKYDYQHIQYYLVNDGPYEVRFTAFSQWLMTLVFIPALLYNLYTRFLPNRNSFEGIMIFAPIALALIVMSIVLAIFPEKFQIAQKLYFALVYNVLSFACIVYTMIGAYAMWGNIWLCILLFAIYVAIAVLRIIWLYYDLDRGYYCSGDYVKDIQFQRRYAFLLPIAVFAGTASKRYFVNFEDMMAYFCMMILAFLFATSIFATHQYIFLKLYKDYIPLEKIDRRRIKEKKLARRRIQEVFNIRKAEKIRDLPPERRDEIIRYLREHEHFTIRQINDATMVSQRKIAEAYQNGKDVATQDNSAENEK